MPRILQHINQFPMTPKEKAIELRDKYIFTSFIIDEDYDSIKLKLMLHAKRSALIAVDEIIKQWEYMDSILINCWSPNKIGLNYWKQVKQEIEKL